MKRDKVTHKIRERKARSGKPANETRTSGGRKAGWKMGRIQAKRMEPVAYYLYRDAKSYQAGKPPLHAKLGPYASMKEAEAKREEQEAWGLPGYEYHYRIAVEPILIPK